MGSTQGEVLLAVADCSRAGHPCDRELLASETPEHVVHLSAFWLDRTEVTVADYRRCVAARRCHPAPFAEGGRRFDRPHLPVTLVTWNDAGDYCRFRGARLPTEAEFERAARGLSGRRYPWGNLPDQGATNHGRDGWSPTDPDDGYEELAPVGSFPSGRTPEGFLDLAGNAAEWVSDRFGPYPHRSVRDPQGAALGQVARTIRGGHYAASMPWLRGAARLAAEPTVRRPFLGFRCARSAEPAWRHP